MKILLLLLAFAFVLMYMYKVWKLNPCIVFLGSLFFVEIIWEFISIIWIDTGTYISEQVRYSYFTGASIRYCVLIMPAVILYPLLLNKSIKNRRLAKSVSIKFSNRHNKLKIEMLLYIISLFVIFYLFFDLLVSKKIPLFYGINYSKYFNNYSKMPLSNNLYEYFLPFISVYFGVLTGDKESKSKSFIIYVSSFLLILILQVLLNNKFYGIYDFVLQFLLGYYISNQKFNHNKKIPYKYLAFCIIGVLILLVICYLKYMRTESNPFQYLLDRIFSLQSHTFWGIDKLRIEGKLNVELKDYIKELLSGLKSIGSVSILDPDYGIARVMYFVTLDTFAYDMISTGYLFSGSYLTINLSYMNYFFTFITSILLSFILVKSSSALYWSIITRNYLMLYFNFWVFKRLFEYFRVGNYSMILNWKFLLIYFIFIILYLYRVINKDN